MMRYAGFFSRAVAMLVDALILLPLGVLFMWSMTLDGTVLLWLAVILAAAGAAYPIWFHARSGQTLGKRFMDIRVVRVGGERISWREALLRSSVDVAFSIAQTVALLITLHQLADLPADIAWYERSRLFAEHNPTWAKALSNVAVAWSCSELVVLLFNEKRRAAHDYIAGTVVVHDEPESVREHGSATLAAAELGGPSTSEPQI